MLFYHLIHIYLYGTSVYIYTQWIHFPLYLGIYCFIALSICSFSIFLPLAKSYWPWLGPFIAYIVSFLISLKGFRVCLNGYIKGVATPKGNGSEYIPCSPALLAHPFFFPFLILFSSNSYLNRIYTNVIYIFKTKTNIKLMIKPFGKLEEKVKYFRTRYV